jgi:hypothetical protein
MEFARKYKKPRLHLHPGISEVADKLRALVQEKSVKVLNVAGPRASKEPRGRSVCDGAVRRGSWYAGLTALCAEAQK